MGKKIQGAKLRALKRSKVALEELQERQAEEAVMMGTTNMEDLFVVDRTGTSHIPHHLRPSKVHKANATNVKFARNHLSSIDEQKVQKLLEKQQRQKKMPQMKHTTTTTAAATTAVVSTSTNRRPKTTSIQRQKVHFDLWQDEDQPDTDARKTTTGTAVVVNKCIATPKLSSSSSSSSSSDALLESSTTAATTTTTATATETTSSIVPRTVKLTAEGIRNIVVSTATAIKDSIWNRFMTQTAPAGIAPVHVVTKALPTTISHKIKHPVITKVVGDTKHVIPIAKKQVAIDTSLTAGQSYHPDPVQHQQLLQTAIQIEVARNKAIEKAVAPISQGLSAETRAILMNDDSDDDDDDKNEEEGTNASMAVGEIPKRLNKLTTAQRNKQKLRRQQEAILRKQKMAKKLLNDGEIPKYQKELKRQQQQSTQKQLQKIQQLQSKLQTNPLGAKIEIMQSRANPILAPTLPIALPPQLAGKASTSSSLSSSLRTIQPKGSMITDRAYSLSSRHPSISPVIPTKRDLNTSLMNNNKSPMGLKLAPHKHRKKRKLSMKGKRNSSTRGEDFEILG
jgi:hypothetical protein